MNFIEQLSDNGDTRRGRIDGVVIGIVTDLDDKAGLNRVCVQFPWLNENAGTAWARVAAPMAGSGRGMFFMPEVHDEVLVCFEHGDPRFPFVIGSLWNGKDSPPASISKGKNDVRVIKSRSGHMIRMTDTAGSEKVEIIDKAGNSVTLDSKANKITIAAPKGTIRLDAMKIEIEASTTAVLKGATVNIN